MGPGFGDDIRYIRDIHMIYLNFDTSWICDTFKLNMLQLKHMKYPSNNKSLYSRKAPESCTWWKRFCAWACLESSDAHSTQENSLNSPHTFWSNEHTLCLNVMCQAHLIRRLCIFVCEQKHCTLHMSSGEAEKGRYENPPFNLLPTRGSLFTQLYFASWCLPALSTGSTCSEENTSDIDKNCLFFPPASLLIRGPCFNTSHAGG